MFRTVVILGVGLIGGSFALALRRAGKVEHIVGVDRDPATAQRALQLGVIDSIANDAGDAVADADLIVLALPVAQTLTVLTQIAARLDDAVVITDVGSTKSDVVTAARRALGARFGQFVPGHPIAGREIHGPDAALASLYDGRNVILTPLPETQGTALQQVHDAWLACGAHVITMDVVRHDGVLAAVSHLPHLLSYALVAHIVDSDDAELKLDLAGAGFRDFTRIAASSPEMWRDIVLANREALLADLDAYSAVVAELRSSIAVGDAAAIQSLFAKASRTRLAWKSHSD